MITTWPAAFDSPALTATAGLVIVIIVVGGLLIRFVLCGLAIYATIKALKAEVKGASSEALRAHRLRVLQAVLTALRGMESAATHLVRRIIAGKPEASREVNPPTTGSNTDAP
jgi:hypothetical protein